MIVPRSFCHVDPLYFDPEPSHFHMCNANLFLIRGTSRQYLALKEKSAPANGAPGVGALGIDAPGGGALGIGLLVDAGFLPKCPVCPNGGTYHLDQMEAGGFPLVYCDVHGAGNRPWEGHAIQAKAVCAMRMKRVADAITAWDEASKTDEARQNTVPSIDQLVVSGLLSSSPNCPSHGMYTIMMTGGVTGHTTVCCEKHGNYTPEMLGDSSALCRYNTETILSKILGFKRFGGTGGLDEPRADSAPGIDELLEKQHLDEMPVCPDGGSYAVHSDDLWQNGITVTCTVHAEASAHIEARTLEHLRPLKK
jgi:hypothetical protein